MITKALIESNLSAKQIVARLLGEDAIPHDYNFPTEGGNFGGRGSKPPGYGGSGGRGNFGGGNDGGFDWDAWNGEPDDNGFNVPIKQGGAKRGQGNPDGPLDFDEFKDWFKNDFGEVGAGPDLDALLEIIPRLVKQGTSKQAIANVMRVRPDAIKQLTSILVGTVENNRDAHLVMDVCLASKIFDQQNLDWIMPEPPPRELGRSAKSIWGRTFPILTSAARLGKTEGCNRANGRAQTGIRSGPC